MANPSQTMINDLSITSQSTKIAMDPNGTVIYNAGYGDGGIQDWTDVLTLLRLTAKAVRSTDIDNIPITPNEELRNCDSCLTLAQNVCKNHVQQKGVKSIHCDIADSLSS